jgi:phenylpyruvate tautomerase PptA (4-oxalocrotonate tautomerase family)
LTSVLFPNKGRRKPTGRRSWTAFAARCAKRSTCPKAIITEHDAANFRHGAAYGVARSDDLVYIQITVFNTRTLEQKKALFRRIAELLGENPGIRPEDVFVNIFDTPKENWSVGHGAQFA